MMTAIIQHDDGTWEIEYTKRAGVKTLWPFMVPFVPSHSLPTAKVVDIEDWLYDNIGEEFQNWWWRRIDDNGWGILMDTTVTKATLFKLTWG